MEASPDKYLKTYCRLIKELVYEKDTYRGRYAK